MHTILFADDMDQIRDLFCAALRAHGYAVLPARDGDEAISLARKHPGSIELLITDVVMPGLNGPGLWRALKNCHPETSVLFISGYCPEELKGAGSFLQKPFTSGMLLRRVESLLSERNAANQYPKNQHEIGDLHTFDS